MIHPDYQYDSRVIPHAVGIIELGICDVVLGSRIRSRAEAMARRHAGLEVPRNRFLTGFENLALGQNLGDFHSGFPRLPPRGAGANPLRAQLRRLRLRHAIPGAGVRFGFRLGDVPVPVRYFDEASSINFRRSVKYGISTLGVVGQYWLDRLGLRPSPLFLPCPVKI